MLLPGCFAAVRVGDHWRILGVSAEAPLGPTVCTIAIIPERQKRATRVAPPCARRLHADSARQKALRDAGLLFFQRAKNAPA